MSNRHALERRFRQSIEQADRRVRACPGLFPVTSGVMLARLAAMEALNARIDPSETNTLSTEKLSAWMEALEHLCRHPGQTPHLMALQILKNNAPRLAIAPDKATKQRATWEAQISKLFDIREKTCQTEQRKTA